VKRELGISVYPDHSDPQTDRDYIKKAAELGYTRIFMSMLEVTEGKEKVSEKFGSIIQYAKDLLVLKQSWILRHQFSMI
jgi:hypothetical protein